MVTSLSLGRIPVGILTRDTFVFNAKLSAEDLDMQEYATVLENGLHASGTCEKANEEVMANARLEAKLKFECSRCLESFETEYDNQFAFSVPIAGNRYVSLLPLIREEIIVNQPIHTLCKPTCKGLCSHCGQNQNTVSCNCEVEVNSGK